MTRGLTGLLLALIVAAAPPVRADGDPSGSSGDGGELKLDAWLAIGAGAVVMGLLLWDAFGSEPAVETPEVPAVDTGIDWSSVETPEPAATGSIVVSPADGGSQDAAQAILVELRTASGIAVYGDPVMLAGEDRFGMARDFFGAGWLVVVSAAEDSALVSLEDGTGLVWSGTFTLSDGAGAARAVLRAVENGI